MTDLDEVDPAIFLQRADDAVNAVSRIAIDAGDTPGREAVDQEIGGVHACLTPFEAAGSSPFGEAAVLLAPDRVAPSVGLLLQVADDVFVDGDAQARSLGNG